MIFWEVHTLTVSDRRNGDKLATMVYFVDMIHNRACGANYDDTIDDVRKKIKYDILYIKRMCFWTDVRILARTARVVVTGAGAR